MAKAKKPVKKEAKPQKAASPKPKTTAKAKQPEIAAYSNIQKEETLKAQVFRDFFNKAKYAYEPETDNIDFIVTDSKLQKES